QSSKAEALARRRRPPFPPPPHEPSDARGLRPPPPAMSRRRPRGGTQRMDAAIDHFAIMGYRKADVRSVVNRLLRDVYGRDGWPFLEDSCYSVVQDALFEMQEEQDKLQLQAVQQPQEEDGDADADDGGGDDDDEEEAQVSSLLCLSMSHILM
uniref:WIYLD domain-containing protein n=1 Tax=Aegilops tauschii subsp. strangulata TaxID=200361 RepID=A0A453T4Q8_AEGTS